MVAATNPWVPELEFLWFAQGKNMRHLAESRNPSPGGGVSCRLRHGGKGTAAGQPDSRAALRMQNPPAFGRCCVSLLCVLDPVESHHGADVEGVGHHRHRHRSRSLGKGRGALAVTAMVALVLRSSQS